MCSSDLLTIATGLDEHDHYGRDFLQAVSWIKKNLPHCSTIGGVSNLSFAFRGNNVLRDNMHAIFLDLSELDMGIVNPAVSRDVQSIGPRTKDIITRALLAQGDDLPSVRRELIDLALETEAEEPSGKAGQAEQEKKPQHNTSDE